MGKQNIKAEILSQKKLSADIFDMTLNVGDMARRLCRGSSYLSTSTTEANFAETGQYLWY